MGDDGLGWLTFGSKIGAGAFCKVIKATGHYDDTGETIPYALKVYKKSTLNRACDNAQVSNLVSKKKHLGIMKIKDQVANEVKFWGKLKHKNIVKAFIWFEDLENTGHDKSYLMMQFADYG